MPNSTRKKVSSHQSKAEDKYNDKSKSASRSKRKVDLIPVTKLHARNRHHARYPLTELVAVHRELKPFIKLSPGGEQTIDFTQLQAVFHLNKALLKFYYKIQFWQFPSNYLCPPIPGRADYLHYLADLLAESEPNKQIPKGQRVNILDVGTGANCIYPLLGESIYGWLFTGSDINPEAVEAAQLNLTENGFSSKVKLQSNHTAIFDGVLNGQYAATMCNPPFYKSQQEADRVNLQKQQKLNHNRIKKGLAPQPINKKRNFAGQNAELWCDGGELAFLLRMIEQSQTYQTQVKWFTTLVSNKENVKPLKAKLKQLSVNKVRVVEMEQGQKISRILAWQFCS